MPYLDYQHSTVFLILTVCYFDILWWESLLFFVMHILQKLKDKIDIFSIYNMLYSYNVSFIAIYDLTIIPKTNICCEGLFWRLPYLNILLNLIKW